MSGEIRKKEKSEHISFRDIIVLYIHRLGRRRNEGFFLRPFLMQSDLSVENGLFRLKPKSGFLTQSKKGFFDREFRLADPVEKLDFYDWILQSKNSGEKVSHVFFEPIASLIPPPNTHPHGHTPIPGTTLQYHTGR